MTAPDPSETRLVEIVFPEQANHYGTLFGGTALNLMSKAAAIAAARRAGCSVVMASSDKVDFHSPVMVGQVVDVLAETLGKSERKLTMRGSFEMVAVDADGRPTPIASAAAD